MNSTQESADLRVLKSQRTQEHSRVSRLEMTQELADLRVPKSRQTREYPRVGGLESNQELADMYRYHQDYEFWNLHPNFV